MSFLNVVGRLLFVSVTALIIWSIHDPQTNSGWISNTTTNLGKLNIPQPYHDLAVKYVAQGLQAYTVILGLGAFLYLFNFTTLALPLLLLAFTTNAALSFPDLSQISSGSVSPSAENFALWLLLIGALLASNSTRALSVKTKKD